MSLALRAGVASRDVTPAEPVPLSGYGGREGLSEGVHDPLGVRALVLADGARTIGLVNVDLLNASRPLVATARRNLAARGIDLDAVTVAATHTHAAPYVPTPAIDVHPNLARDRDTTGYVETVAEACANAVAEARDALAPAELRVGTAENRDAPENRRANQGWGARVPRGPIDPELVALSVLREDGGETVVYDYALHPVCTTPGENLISADWPGYAAERVRERREDVDEVLFLNGASGDVNPRGKTAGDRASEGEGVYDYMAEIGHGVGDSVLDALGNADDGPRITRGPLHVDSRDLRLPVKDPGTPAELRRRLDHVEERVAALEADSEAAMAAHLRGERSYLVEQLAIAEWDVTHLPATLRYVELGPVGLLAVPAEVFVDHGRTWKDAAAVDHLLPVTYADDYVGYVPELRDLENGGYEVETCKISPEAIRRIRETGSELVR